MEPPPPPSAAAVPVLPAAAHANCHESIDSSPRSRHTESSEENHAPQIPSGGGKLRLMCSYGGHIMPRPHDKSLRYVGGETRMVVADRNSSLSELTNRLSKTLLSGKSFTLKYQLPNEDLDSLISVTTDEDLENMIEEYERISASSAGSLSQKSSRLRLFLFPSKPDSSSSFGSLLENSVKSEGWFLDALNGTTRPFSESASVDCLLGLDEDIAAIAGNNDCSSAKEAESQLKGVGGNSSKLGAQDIQSVPDSPMLETTSSFGSASSSPLLANLPPIRIRPEEHKPQVSGIEDQFLQMNVAGAPPMQKQEDGGSSNFMIPSSTTPTVLTTPAVIALAPSPSAPLATFGASGDYLNRVFSDDERSDQGARKPSQLQSQPPPPSFVQPKPTSSGVDLASPDSVSSENSSTNPLSRQRTMLYQDPGVQFQNSSLNNRVPVNHVDQTLSDLNSTYLLPTQFDHQQQQQHQQINLQQQQQQPSQQFIQAGTHYIHQQPISPYYSLYPTQHQALHHPHQVIYVQARPPPAYNMPVHPSNYSDGSASAAAATGTVPSSQAMIAGKQEMASAMYRTGAAGAGGGSGPQQLVQVGSSQHQPQYIGYSQIHHPSHSMTAAAPTSGANNNGNYGYEYVEHHPTHGQIFYTTQQLPPQQMMTGQYQNIISSAPPPMATAMSEAAGGSSQLPGESMKQQMRTSQPL
ncbi:uncharacterized protein LOC124925432 [Impatiens glandulifera]|uniref:uncharacterized protein LOC124925432 n=1 Tax=Impatiens glandulifera TaxID=253017 RepID=UPI001FB0F9D3|nr:uncharacterized protein LOC124925432 [Impatiens glandulifera]